jgi:hypothetical protein
VRDEVLSEDQRYEHAAITEAFVILDVHDAGLMTYDVYRLLVRVRVWPEAEMLGFSLTRRADVEPSREGVPHQDHVPRARR